jgi:hypothetical protein
MNERELVHYGVKGMKWGILRYQNPDGTLTAAGKVRDRMTRKRNLKKAEKILKGSKKTVKRRLSQITDEELQKAVNRLQLERTYKNLTTPPDKHKKAKEIATKWLETAGTKVIESAATNLGKKIFSETDSKRKVEKRADIELEKDRQDRRIARVKAERDARAKEKAAKEKQAADWKKAEETIRRSSNWKEFEKKRNQQ